MSWSGSLESAWRELAGVSAPAGLQVRNWQPAPLLPSPFALDEAAVASVGAALLAAGECAEARGLARPAPGSDRACW